MFNGVVCKFYEAGSLSKLAFAAFFTLFVMVLGGEPGFAQDVAADVNDVAENVVNNVSQLPSLISALAYLTAVYFGAIGVNKLRLHVENPSQNSLGSATGRLLIGGALFALPTVYSAMYTAITGGGQSRYAYDDSFSATEFMSSVFGDLSAIMGDIGLTRDLNAVLNAILESIGELPFLLSAFAYLIGLYLGVMALIKLKEHIEDPDRNPMKEALIRFFIGGAFLAIPTIYTVMATATGGDQSGVLDTLSSVVDAYGFLESAYNPSRGCTEDILYGMADSMTFGMTSELTGAQKTLGTAICQFYGHTASLPAFLSAISKLLGFFFGFWALLKLRDHMLDPRQTPISQAVTRFIAGGCFLSIQAMIAVIKSTTTPAASQTDDIVGDTISDYNVDADCSTSAISGVLAGIDNAVDGAIDSAVDSAVNSIPGVEPSSADTGTATAQATGMGKTIYCAVTDVAGPIHTSLNFFAFAAGIAFLMIGISRLLKSEQDGPRAPAGIGTIGTFITAGVLMSFSDFVRIITMSIFTEGQTAVYAELAYEASVEDKAALGEFYAVVSGILKFMIIIGLISFARGIFILRGVSEGNNQSSMMAGVTHIIGGALAVNLGPLLNLIQLTLGIDGYGMMFK